MRNSRAAIAALVGAPALLVGTSALALEVTFEQASGLAGGAALGVVGGPVGGFIGGMLGRAVGRTIHHPARPVDLTDLKSRPHVTPINDGPFLNEAVEDRAVDSTPIRMIEVQPTRMDAQTYLANAPRSSSTPHTYLASARRRAPRERTYLASAPRPEPQAETAAAHAIPAAAVVSDNPNARPGTLDYQLNQVNAHRAAEGAAQIQKVADVH